MLVERRVQGMSLSIWKTRLPTDLPESATLAYETQDSATNGFASPSSHWKSGEKLWEMNALHTFTGERAKRKVVQRPTSMMKCCKNWSEKADLHLRISKKTARKTFLKKWHYSGIIDIYEISTTSPRIHNTLWPQKRSKRAPMRGYTCEVDEGVQRPKKVKNELQTSFIADHRQIIKDAYRLTPTSRNWVSTKELPE